MNITQRIKNALGGKPISSIGEVDIRNEFKGFLFEAFGNMGIKPNEPKAEDYSYRLLYYVKHYPFLTLEDVRNIFYFGSIGLWGESFKLSMQTIHKWFEEYLKERGKIFYDEQRSELVTTYERLQFLHANRDHLPTYNKLFREGRTGRNGLKRIDQM